MLLYHSFCESGKVVRNTQSAPGKKVSVHDNDVSEKNRQVISNTFLHDL